jgi:hypothetical protein
MVKDWDNDMNGGIASPLELLESKDTEKCWASI